MKKIGLVGGTGPESTLMYYRELTFEQRQLPGRLPRQRRDSSSKTD